MSNDTLRSELAELRDTVHAGFARMDRYIELSQAQYLELRGEVRELRNLLIALTGRVDRIEVRLGGVEKQLGGVEERLGGVEERLDGLENQVRQFRDWVTRELADVRHEIRLLRQVTEESNTELRRVIDALDARVTRLEQRRDDALS
jgi:archaellum component FlaC